MKEGGEDSTEALILERRWVGDVTLPTSSPMSPALKPQDPKFPIPNPTPTTPPLNMFPEAHSSPFSTLQSEWISKGFQGTLPPVHVFHSFIYTFLIPFIKIIFYVPRDVRQARQNPCLHRAWLWRKNVHFNSNLLKTMSSLFSWPSYLKSEISREGRRWSDSMRDASPVTLNTHRSLGGWKNTDHLGNKSMERIHEKQR